MNNLPRHQFHQSDATVLKGHLDVYDASNDLFYRQQIALLFQFRSRFFISRFVVVFLLESFAVFCRKNAWNCSFTSRSVRKPNWRKGKLCWSEFLELLLHFWCAKLSFAIVADCPTISSFSLSFGKSSRMNTELILPVPIMVILTSS